MGRTSKILTSKHKQLIDSLLNEGTKVIDVYRELRKKGAILSLSSLYRYKKRYFVPKRKTNDRLYRILIETGNYPLIKALDRTQRIYETKRKCMCTKIRASELKKKGRVFIHIVCGGWYPYDLGVHLKNSQKKGNEQINNQLFVVSRRRYY